MIEIIAQAQVKAKVNDEKQRMREAAVAIDFYNGRQRDYMESVISYLYPQTWQDIHKYIAISDITRGIINQKSIIFQSPPEIEISTPGAIGENGKDNTSPALKEAFKTMLSASDIHKKLIGADRMAELTGKVGITLHWHEAEKRVVLDLVTPDKCFVIADSEDPTKPAIVYYRVGLDNDPRTASPLNVYGKWTLEGYSEVVLSDDLKEIKTTKPLIPNIYGMIPFIWLSPDIEIDSFWIDRGYPLIEGNVNINLRKSNLDLALDFQSFSTLVTKGLESGKTQDTITGITRRLDFLAGDFGNSTDSQAYYITPDAKLQEVAAIINDKEISLAKENGLSADAFNQDASKISSGYQLRLTQKQIEENNDLKKTIYREQLITLFKLMMMCHNAKSTGSVFPIDSIIYFNYIDRKSANNPIETAALHITKINANLMSEADAIREMNPDLTQDEAIEEAKRIRKERQELNGGIRQMNEADLGIEA